MREPGQNRPRANLSRDIPGRSVAKSPSSSQTRCARLRSAVSNGPPRPLRQSMKNKKGRR
jgi:hypothetical protein